tara:strand:- start:11128 stop:11544 length:417 start_codon:yes stop_codon:yes gene_type:complete
MARSYESKRRSALATSSIRTNESGWQYIKLLARSKKVEVLENSDVLRDYLNTRDPASSTGDVYIKRVVASLGYGTYEHYGWVKLTSEQLDRTLGGQLYTKQNCPTLRLSTEKGSNLYRDYRGIQVAWFRNTNNPLFIT